MAGSGSRMHTQPAAALCTSSRMSTDTVNANLYCKLASTEQSTHTFFVSIRQDAQVGRSLFCVEIGRTFFVSRQDASREGRMSSDSCNRHEQRKKLIAKGFRGSRRCRGLKQLGGRGIQLGKILPFQGEGPLQIKGYIITPHLTEIVVSALFASQIPKRCGAGYNAAGEQHVAN